jgi:hypothetical protein
MMGFFAVYAAYLHGCFSLGLNLFGTRFAFDGQSDGSVEVMLPRILPSWFRRRSVYPFGLDLFACCFRAPLFNSFKMKLV